MKNSHKSFSAGYQDEGRGYQSNKFRDQLLNFDDCDYNLGLQVTPEERSKLEKEKSDKEKSDQEKSEKEKSQRKKKSRDPPTRDLFEEFYPKKDEDKEKLKWQTKRCSNQGPCNCYGAWVTVFGYPKRYEELVIHFFLGIGCLVDRYVHDTGNWMYLRYKTNLDCKNVMKYSNYPILPQNLYVGVILGAPTNIKELSEKRFANPQCPECPSPPPHPPQSECTEDSSSSQESEEQVNPDSLQPAEVCPESPQFERDRITSPQPQCQHRLFGRDRKPIIKQSLWERTLELLELN